MTTLIMYGGGRPMQNRDAILPSPPPRLLTVWLLFCE